MSKKQIIQLLVLALSLYLGLFFIMENNYYQYYDAFGLLSLVILLGAYVVYGRSTSKIVGYLRVVLYVVLGFLIYLFLKHTFGFGWNYGNVVTYPVVNLWSKVFAYLVAVTFHFYPAYILLVCGVLVLNKPVNIKTFKIGKFRIDL